MDSPDNPDHMNNGYEKTATLNRGDKSATLKSRQSMFGGNSTPGQKRVSRMKPSHSKLNFGDATDDVHVCIMCLRAIMNHQVCGLEIKKPIFHLFISFQYGFNLVFAHKQAINCIALSLNHKSLRSVTFLINSEFKSDLYYQDESVGAGAASGCVPGQWRARNHSQRI